jgi:tRNA A-37 threonylcarbamoyl transferase component Bud32
MSTIGQIDMKRAGRAPGLAMRPAATTARPPESVQLVIDRVLYSTPEYLRFRNRQAASTDLTDFLFAAGDQPHDAQDIFHRLRWGGLFLFASDNRDEVKSLAETFTACGFRLEHSPAFIRKPWAGLRIPLLSKKIHYFVARKVFLIPPGEDTERFTYQVQLIAHPDPAEPLIVLKEVPSVESVIARLKRRFPEVTDEILEKRARKFTERIFPTFLTREAAILKILAHTLPEPYSRRVPHVIKLEKDDRGFVTKLYLNWLRNGGEPLSQMEFARQSADLLHALHDIAHVIHLDLRLDNFVITEEGVGFVDFGSSVRDDENLAENPMLKSLFEDLMRTSQIQRMLEKMTVSGAVTSQVIRAGIKRVDKAVDFFYLAVQFNSPHQNPDLAGLIEYDPASREARDLAKLTEEILRPADPASPTFRSAKDIFHGIERMQLGLDRRKR